MMMVTACANEQRCIERLRTKAEVVLADNVRTGIRLMGVIACSTHDVLDVAKAVETARQHAPRKFFAGQVVAGIVRSYCLIPFRGRETQDEKTERVGRARKIAEQMHGMDIFWQAIARIFIAGASGLPADVSDADRAIAKLVDHAGKMNEARNCLKVVMRTGVNAKQRVFIPELRQIEDILGKLEVFESEDMTVVRGPSSPSLRARMDELISHILAGIME